MAAVGGGGGEGGGGEGGGGEGGDGEGGGEGVSHAATLSEQPRHGRHRGRTLAKVLPIVSAALRLRHHRIGG